MGALYEDVENFFGDIFAFYGRFLSKFPIVCIVVSLLTSALLGMGLLSMSYETDVETLYTPLDSPALKDRDRLTELFPDRTAKEFYYHQQLYLSTYGEVFLLPLEDEGDVLEAESAEEILNLYSSVMEISLERDDRGFSYSDLCAARQNVCVVYGSALLKLLSRDPCYNPNDTFPWARDPETSFVDDLSQVLAGVHFRNGCLAATAMRMRFNLRHDTARQRELSMLWERAFLHQMESKTFTTIRVSYASSESLDIELTEHVGQDTEFFLLTIFIMILYSAFVSCGGNWVSTRVLLALAGILAALLAILASFGLLSMCGMKFVDICGVMPFLVLGVGVDDMFILMSGWRQTQVDGDVESRVAETFRSSAISVTITSLTDLLAFCIGATSPFLNVKNFCVFTGVAIFFCYFNQLTFFGGCMVLHARRVNQSRHCITCRKTKSRVQMKEDGYSKIQIICCSGHPPRSIGEDDSLCEKIPSTFIPKILLKGWSKTVIMVGYIVYLAISIWGASHIKTGLKLETVVAESSYLNQYNQIKQQYFSTHGPRIMFVIDGTVPYHAPETQREIEKVLNKAQGSGYLDPKFRISWLQQYLKFKHNRSEPVDMMHFMPGLDQFLELYPEHKSDIVYDSEHVTIAASRFYLASLNFEYSEKEGEMMLLMREIAMNSSLPLMAYSPDFIYYEHYVSILKNTLLSVGVAIIAMLFIALMFIPHPISVTCVTLTMVSIVLGMFGFMQIWGLALSAITTVQIILSVGFCVDFTVHISHAFMCATGKNRNERVMRALDKVGIPILHGALSSILGILMLAFASSYTFTSFFKTMLLVILLGLVHSLLLLPVMLSFIGPRRTSRPRVFIPISSPANRPPGDAAAYKAKTDAQKERMRLRSMKSIDGAEHLELLPIHKELEEEAEAAVAGAGLLGVPTESASASHSAESVDKAGSGAGSVISVRSSTPSMARLSWKLRVYNRTVTGINIVMMRLDICIICKRMVMRVLLMNNNYCEGFEAAV